MVFQKVEYYGWNLLSVFLRGNLLGGVLWVEVPCFTHSGVEIPDEFLTVGGKISQQQLHGWKFLVLPILGWNS